jgi:hypothetical protein
VTSPNLGRENYEKAKFESSFTYTTLLGGLLAATRKATESMGFTRIFPYGYEAMLLAREIRDRKFENC